MSVRTPTSVTPDEPHLSPDDDVPASGSSYAGSDGATASEQDVEEAMNANRLREGETTDSEASGSEVDSVHGRARSSTIRASSTRFESITTIPADSDLLADSREENRFEDESVVDFLRAVPGPHDTDSPRTDGPFISSRETQGGNGLPSDAAGSSRISEDLDGRSSSAGLEVETEPHSATPPSRRHHDTDEDVGSLGTAIPIQIVRSATEISTDLDHQAVFPFVDPGENNALFGDGSESITQANLRARGSSQRDGQDVVLPRWQPDAEVTYCPICKSQFSFFVRKHHCRKCGRVVCASCSPHRITIPYQYIVQDTASQQGVERRLEPTDSQGGMKVRLCNPCVPDPNTSAPLPQDSPPSYYIATGNRGFTLTEQALNDLERQESSTSINVDRDPLTSRARAFTAASALSANQRRSAQRTESTRSRHGTISASGTGSSFPNNRMSARTEVTGLLPRYSTANESQRRGHTSRHQSLSVMGTASTRPQHYRPSMSSTDRDRPLPPVPRIAEEDECPICHRELPARSLPNYEVARETHIMRCIDEQMTTHNSYSSRLGAYTSSSQPSPIMTVPSHVETPQSNPSDGTSGSGGSLSPVNSRGSPSTPLNLPHNLRLLPSIIAEAPRVESPQPIANTPEARMAAREQAHAAVVLGLNRSASGSESSARRTGMFPYKATEKDCVDDAECTICLEEFHVGVAMARLECLCRFHRECIQEWFVGHPGMCPVHQHDGYGF